MVIIFYFLLIIRLIKGTAVVTALLEVVQDYSQSSNTDFTQRKSSHNKQSCHQLLPSYTRGQTMRWELQTNVIILQAVHLSISLYQPSSVSQSYNDIIRFGSAVRLIKMQVIGTMIGSTLIVSVGVWWDGKTTTEHYIKASQSLRTES